MSRPLMFMPTLSPGCAIVDALVVHLDGEHLAGAGVGDGVGRDEDNLLTGADATLLDAAGEDITDTLDLVHAGDGEAHRRRRARRSGLLTMPLRTSRRQSTWCLVPLPA